MSKRTERREAERAAHKTAFQALHQQPQPEVNPVASLEPKPVPEPDLETSKKIEYSQISYAQFAANRANAQLSTGATTEQGKAKSSMNALKHGLTGHTVLLPTDDPAEYEHQLQARIRTLKPASEEELTVVQSMLDSAWRIARIKTLETGIMLKGQIEFVSKFEDQTPSRRAQLIGVETYLKYEKSIRNLNIQEARLYRRLEKDQAELLRLQSDRKRETVLAAQAKPPAEPNGFEFSTPPIRQENQVKYAQATPGIK